MNVRIRKAAKRGAKVFVVGPQWDTTYPAEFLGDDLSVLGALPKHVVEALKGAERPAIIMGGAALAKGALGAGLPSPKATSARAKDGWNGFNVLHFRRPHGRPDARFRAEGRDEGHRRAKPKVVFSLGADEMDFEPFADALKVYIGHHGDAARMLRTSSCRAASFAEKDGTYVNTEGRVQFAEKAVFAPGDAREDWTILRALADALKVEVGFDSFAELQAAMIREVPALGEEGLALLWALPNGGRHGRRPKGGFASADPIEDFYLTNPIARASAVMQQCSSELLGGGEACGGRGMTEFFQVSRHDLRMGLGSLRRSRASC